MRDKIEISIVIPVFNEVSNIIPLYQKSKMKLISLNELMRLFLSMTVVMMERKRSCTKSSNLIHR
jgi:hypothetical protein